MKTIFNTLTTAALTVLLFAGTPPGPALANATSDATLSPTSSALSDATTPESTPLSGLQALALGSSSIPPAPNPPKQRYKKVDSGGATVCAIRAGGQGIDCFGFNQLQQAEPPKGSFKALSMGQLHGCALTNVGQMKCWGNPSAYPTPEAVKKERYKQISAGTDHTCALTTRGGLSCWGNNDLGEMNVPAAQFIDLSAKSDHTCAIDKANNLLCWGDQAFTSYGPFPGQYTEVTTGNLHVCALRKSDKRAVCWGNNAFGQATPPIDEFVSLTSGSYHTCGQRADKTSTCWGKNDYGQAAQDPRRFAQIAAGGNLTCALIQGSQRLACQGSFAFNEDLFQQGKDDALLNQAGIAKPQGALDSWVPGGLDWFGSSLSNGLGTFFDTSLSKWVKAANYGNIAFGLASLLISNLLGAEDPNEEILKQLAEIKVSLTNISSAIQTLNTMVASNNYMVAANWCDSSIATLASVEKDVRIGLTYKGPIGGWRTVIDDYQKYLNELESLKKNSLANKQPIDQALLDRKLTDLLAKVDAFKKDWLSSKPNGKNIERMRHDLTEMLLGKTTTSPLEACKAKSYQAWKSSPNLYPFDDRPIWAEATKVFIKTMSIQDQLADIETGVNSFEMMRVFQAPTKDAQGNAIPAYQWKPREGDPGLCKLAQQSQFIDAAPQRLKEAWGSDAGKGPCQIHQDIVKDIYLDQVRQFEAMGGAYSDDNVVLSMTSRQMGVTDASNQSNWLWFRKADLVPVIETYKDMADYPSNGYFWRNKSSRYGKPSASSGSPFANLFPVNINGNTDYRQYLTPSTIEGNIWGGHVWHSNGQAWKDVFQAREEIKNQTPGEKDRHEDFMQSMAELKDPVKSCMNEKCSEVQVKDKYTGEIITIRQPDKSGFPAFVGVSKKPFWVTEDNGIVHYKVFDMRLKSFEYENRNGNSANVKTALPCFMAENINDGRKSDGTSMDGYSWYHPGNKDDINSKYDESKREYLKLSGKVCGDEEFAALLRTNSNLDWKNGINCTDKERCYGLGGFFPVNPKFDQYKEYFGGVGYAMIYENAANDIYKHGTQYQYGIEATIDKTTLYHMPVVKVSGMPCNPKLVADNIEAIWQGQDQKPVYSLRSGERTVGDGKSAVPSVCGNNLDRIINRYVPKSPYIDMPGIRTISAQ